MYTLLYVIFSILTIAAQVLAYTSSDWSSSVARTTSYFFVYRVTNLACTTSFVVLGLYTDMKFIYIYSCGNSYTSLDAIKLYYNHWIYLTYEILLYFIFSGTAIWATLNVDAVASVYIEQFLLSIMSLNGIYLVQLLMLSSTNENDSNNNNKSPPSQRISPKDRGNVIVNGRHSYILRNLSNGEEARESSDQNIHDIVLEGIKDENGPACTSIELKSCIPDDLEQCL
jgi:hypothetical protein